MADGEPAAPTVDGELGGGSEADVARLLESVRPLLDADEALREWCGRASSLMPCSIRMRSPHVLYS